MAIVNYSAIIFPVSVAMSEGDVIRLNRMYKCGPLYQTQTSNTMQPTQPETGNESREKTSSEIENVKHKKSKLFGIFIFKDIGEN